MAGGGWDGCGVRWWAVGGGGCCGVILGIGECVMVALVASDVGSRLLGRAKAIQLDRILPKSKPFPFLYR